MSTAVAFMADIVLGIIGFFILSFVEAIIMSRMGWNSLKRSFLHAFGINILSTSALTFIAFRVNAYPYAIASNGSRLLDFTFAGWILTMVVVEGAALTVLNKKLTLRRVWLITAVANTPLILILTAYYFLFLR